MKYEEANLKWKEKKGRKEDAVKRNAVDAKNKKCKNKRLNYLYRIKMLLFSQSIFTFLAP
jgi:hypothetical protein